MPLPKSLQAQADAADATLAQMYPDTHGVQAQAVQVAQPVPPIPVPSVPASEVQPPSVQPLVAPPAPETPPPQQTVDNWEQKYRTLQGIISRQSADFKARIEQLEATNQQLLDRVNASTQPQAQQPPQLNPQDAETFGEDLVRMIQRNVEGVLAPLAQSVEQRLARLETNLQGTNKVVAKTADETFFAALREQVPDFDQVNTSEPFLAWLAEVDDLYGQPRQAALTAAGNARDLARVVGVFKAFKRATGAPDAPPASPASRLQQQVSPHSAGNGGAPVQTASPDKPLITVEQVERFYADVRRGAYRANEPLRAATEAVINDALAEGRILQRGAPRPAM